MPSCLSTSSAEGLQERVWPNLLSERASLVDEEKAWLKLPALILLVSFLVSATGCSSMVESTTGEFADSLSDAILNQDDPETVRDGAPAYLLLVDTFAERSPERPDTLATAAKLYAAYGSVFVDDPLRARRLTARSLDYGERAICAQHEPACYWETLDFDQYQIALDALQPRDVPVLYAYVVSALAYTRAHSDDWSVLAGLPKLEWTLQRINSLDPTYEADQVQVYLGILNSLRPPALGGRPEIARANFESAIQLSEGRNLNAKVEYARSYARLVYERELHDRLLEEVLAADPVAPGLTLFNILAQREATDLLESADDYF